MSVGYIAQKDQKYHFTIQTEYAIDAKNKDRQCTKHMYKENSLEMCFSKSDFGCWSMQRPNSRGKNEIRLNGVENKNIWCVNVKKVCITKITMIDLMLNFGREWIIKREDGAPDICIKYTTWPSDSYEPFSVTSFRNIFPDN